MAVASAVSSARLPLAVIAALAFAGCGGTSPSTTPGPEDCANRVDDNGDGKIDCFDPKCFQDEACAVKPERCDNSIDDNGDALVDCADPLCEGRACATGCVCQGGVRVTGGGGDGGATGGGSGGGGATGGGGGGTTGGGSGGGGAAGGGGGTTGGGGGATGGGGGATGGGGGATTESNCADNLDNDGDNATDCDDTDCVGITCGMGCTCAQGRKAEVSCSDGADNDGDGQADCADPDCVGVGTEVCNDGRDNTCDRAIDCGDPKCSSSPQCANLADGKPCLLDTHCAGAKCLTEAAMGIPNGMCANATSCTVGTNAGCNGGLCLTGATMNNCWPRCTGTGLSGPGACRAGFICLDPDSNTSNGNNYCSIGCAADSECAGTGSGYGCNPWSKRCGLKDRGLGKYGAACTSHAACETNACLQGASSPGGYCAGPCRGDTENCAPGGLCSHDPAYGDNWGMCFKACTTTSECRTSENYKCWGPASDPFGVCSCQPAGNSCATNSDCCSGSCSGFFFPSCD